MKLRERSTKNKSSVYSPSQIDLDEKAALLFQHGFQKFKKIQLSQQPAAKAEPVEPVKSSPPVIIRRESRRLQNLKSQPIPQPKSSLAQKSTEKKLNQNSNKKSTKKSKEVSPKDEVLENVSFRKSFRESTIKKRLLSKATSIKAHKSQMKKLPNPKTRILRSNKPRNPLPYVASKVVRSVQQEEKKSLKHHQDSIKEEIQNPVKCSDAPSLRSKNTVFSEEISAVSSNASKASKPWSSTQQRTREWLTSVNCHLRRLSPKVMSPLPVTVSRPPKKMSLSQFIFNRPYPPTVLEELEKAPLEPFTKSSKIEVMQNVIISEINRKLFPPTKLNSFRQLYEYKEDFRRCHDYYMSTEFCQKVLMIRKSVTNWANLIDDASQFNENAIPHRVSLPSIFQDTYNPYLLLLVIRLLYPLKSSEASLGCYTISDNETCLGLHAVMNSLTCSTPPFSVLRNELPIVRFYSSVLALITLINDVKEKQITQSRQNIFKPNAKFKSHFDFLEALLWNTLCIGNYWVHGKRMESCKAYTSALSCHCLPKESPDESLPPLSRPSQLYDMRYLNEYVRIVTGKEGRFKSMQMNSTLEAMIVILDNCCQIESLGGKIQRSKMRPVEIDVCVINIYWAVLHIYRPPISFHSLAQAARIAAYLQRKCTSKSEEAANTLLIMSNSVKMKHVVAPDNLHSPSLNHDVNSPMINTCGEFNDIRTPHTFTSDNNSRTDLYYSTYTSSSPALESCIARKPGENYPDPKFSSSSNESCLSPTENKSVGLPFSSSTNSLLMENNTPHVLLSPKKENSEDFDSFFDKDIVKVEMNDDPYSKEGESTEVKPLNSNGNNAQTQLKSDKKCDSWGDEDFFEDWEEEEEEELPTITKVHSSNLHIDHSYSQKEDINKEDVFEVKKEVEEPPDESNHDLMNTAGEDRYRQIEEEMEALVGCDTTVKPDTTTQPQSGDFIVPLGQNEVSKAEPTGSPSYMLEPPSQKLPEKVEPPPYDISVSSSQNHSQNLEPEDQPQYDFFVPASQDTIAGSQPFEPPVLPTFFAVVPPADTVPAEDLLMDGIEYTPEIPKVQTESPEPQEDN